MLDALEDMLNESTALFMAAAQANLTTQFELRRIISDQALVMPVGAVMTASGAMHRFVVPDTTKKHQLIRAQVHSIHADGFVFVAEGRMALGFDPVVVSAATKRIAREPWHAGDIAAELAKSMEPLKRDVVAGHWGTRAGRRRLLVAPFRAHGTHLEFEHVLAYDTSVATIGHDPWEVVFT